MELHALIQPILGGLGHGKLAAAEHIVEGNRRRLPGKHGDTVAFLRLVFVIALLGDGIGAGHQIVDANFTVPVGGNGLIDALAGDGEGNAVHFAVLAGLDDFGAAVTDLQIQKGCDRVADRSAVGNNILHGAVRTIVAIAPHHDALTQSLLFGSDPERSIRGILS